MKALISSSSALFAILPLMLSFLASMPASAQYEPPKKDDSTTYDGQTDSSSWVTWANY